MDEKERKELQNKENDIKDDRKNLEELGKLEIDPEDLERVIKELKEKYDLKDENIKIVKIKKTKPNLLKVILLNAFSFLIDLLLIISLNGYLNFSDSHIVTLILFGIVFSITDLLLKAILSRYFNKIIYFTFGLIMIPLTIIALAISYYATGMKFIDERKMILFLILFIIGRVIIKLFMMRKQIMVLRKGGTK